MKNVTTLRPGDARDLDSLTAAIDDYAVLRDIAEAQGNIKLAGEHLHAGLELYKARGRLERAIVACEYWLAVEEIAGRMAS